MRYLGSLFSDHRCPAGLTGDNDSSPMVIMDPDDTVTQDAEQFSHELRVFWNAGERWTATLVSITLTRGFDQHYSIRERAAQGRLINPALWNSRTPNLVVGCTGRCDG